MAGQRLAHLVTLILIAAVGVVLFRQAPALAQSQELNALEEQVFSLYAAGKYAEAIPLAKGLVRGYEAQLGKTHISTANAMNTLAILYKAQGAYAEAEQLTMSSLAIREKALGPDHPAVAQSLNNLAILYKVQGRTAEAEPLYKKSLAIREKALGADHPDVAASLNNLGNLYKDQGRYVEAEPFHKRSLAIKEKAFGAGHPDVASSLNNLAILYVAQGRIVEAEQLYKRTLAIREKALEASHPDVAQAINNLGALYQQQRRYAEAGPLLKRGLALREKLLGPGHPDVAESLENLALVYKDQGRAAEAESYYKRSLAIMERAFGSGHPGVSRSLNNLAWLYTDQGRYAEAESYYKRSLALRETALGSGHPDVADSWRSLGLLFDKQKRWPEAYDALRTSADIRAIFLDREQFASRAGPEEDRFVFSNVTSAGWDLATAEPKRHQEILQATFEDEQLAGRQASAAALSQMAVRLGAGSSGVAHRIREQQDLLAAWERLDKALIGAISEPPARRDEAKISGLRRELEDADGRLKALAAEIGQAFPAYAELANPKPLSVAEAQRLLGADEALVVFMDAARKGTFVWAVTREGVRWQRVPLGPVALRDKVANLRAGLDVDDHTKAAAEGKLFELGLAYELYAALLGPVTDLVGDKRHLMIVPSGPLTSLPFHLLVAEAPATAKPDGRELDAYRHAHWLIRDHAVTVLPSVPGLRTLRVLAKGAQGTKPLVGFGDPVFGELADANARESKGMAAAVTRGRTRSYDSFWRGGVANLDALRNGLAPLPETAAELRTVAKAIGATSSDLHLGRDASETTVKRLDLTPYRVVYFATHGLVSGDVKGLGEPALALTIPNEPTELDDGLLTASEVAQLKLNADWVVLSACNTAAGDKPGAEALSGLARAFFYAGARALLVSHWQVDSNAAVRLTTSTFDALRKDPTIGRAEALRRAMLAMIDDSSNPWNAYPDFWAAFSVVGEGGS